MVPKQNVNIFFCTFQYSFSELPATAHDSLRSSMLDHLSNITEDTYNGIATQLCVAVADLALLMVSWTDPYGDLIKEFGIEGKRPNLVPLLEVFVALPEELNSRQLRLGQNRRDQMDVYCKAQVPNLIQLLVSGTYFNGFCYQSLINLCRLFKHLFAGF